MDDHKAEIVFLCIIGAIVIIAFASAYHAGRAWGLW